MTDQEKISDLQAKINTLRVALSSFTGLLRPEEKELPKEQSVSVICSIEELLRVDTAMELVGPNGE